MFPSLRSTETQHSFCVPRVCAPKKHHEQQRVRNNVSSFASTFSPTSIGDGNIMTMIAVGEQKSVSEQIIDT